MDRKEPIAKKVVILFFLLGILSVCFAKKDDAEEALKRGNYLYGQGEYIGAYETYREMLGEGYWHAYLFYNLGNAYYQNKELGRALLNYRRALMLLPRDKDIRFNYSYVKSLVATETEESMKEFFQRILSYFTVNELTVIVTLIYLVTFVFVFLKALLKKEIYLWLSITLGMVLLICAGILIFRIQGETPRLAIAVGHDQARNGPGNDYSIGFNLPEGKEIEVIDEHGDWFAINLGKEGLKGWVKKNSIEEIDIYKLLSGAR